ncbi:MAG: hypothetical protein RL272_806 [Candidatus Parcubacteria bacterium]|jgi:putative oxidoreductase
MQFFSSLHSLGDLGLLGLRSAVGVIFLVHGLQKRAMWKMQPSEQLPKPMLRILRLLSICEPLGAIAMFAGFFTQLAALCLGIIMLGAINLKAKVMKKKFSEGSVVGWEFDFIIFGACFALYFLGAGRFALDRVWFGL